MRDRRKSRLAPHRRLAVGMIPEECSRAIDGCQAFELRVFRGANELDLTCAHRIELVWRKLRALQNVSKQFHSERLVFGEEGAAHGNAFDVRRRRDHAADSRHGACECQCVALSCALVEKSRKQACRARRVIRIGGGATSNDRLESHQRHIVTFGEDQHCAVGQLHALEPRHFHARFGRRYLGGGQQHGEQKGSNAASEPVHSASFATGASTPTVRLLERSSSFASF